MTDHASQAVLPLRIVVLMDNTVTRAGLVAEHGLAFWIETGARRILFDTGQTDRLAANAPPAELATLYTGLATLYRSRIADGAGAVYAMPLAEVTQAALDRLPADDGRRRELTQWLADGLQVLLTEAQQQQDVHDERHHA